MRSAVASRGQVSNKTKQSEMLARRARASGHVGIAANQRRWMASRTCLPTEEGPQARRPRLNSARSFPIAESLRACRDRLGAGSRRPCVVHRHFDPIAPGDPPSPLGGHHVAHLVTDLW